MKLKLQQVQTAFSTLDNVKVSPIAESSQFVRLVQAGDELTLTLTGLLWAETRLKGPKGGKWTAYADRRLLKAFLSTATGEDVEFFYDGTKLVLRAGQRLEVAPHKEITGYETWKPSATFKIKEEHRDLLKLLVRYLPNLPGSDHVAAVYFGAKYGLITTDTLFLVANQDNTVEREFFLPAAVAQVLSGSEGKLAADKKGVGVALDSGFVYQPLSDDLSRFPVTKCKNMIASAMKEKAAASMSVQELAEVLSTASQFLFDKAEAAEITPSKGQLMITVELAAGKFQRIVTASNVTLESSVNWPLPRLLPWLQYIAQGEKDRQVQYIKLPEISGFRVGKEVMLFAEV